MLKADVIIQARMGAQRLPGKVLFSFMGSTLLEYLYKRLEEADCIRKIIIATTVNPIDDIISELCKIKGYSYFRGSEEDVLERYYETAKTFDCKRIVRVTADNPFTDVEEMKRLISVLSKKRMDYVSNHKTGLPLGLGCEVFTFSALFRAHTEATRRDEREHVTPYFYNNTAFFPQLEVQPLKIIPNADALRLTIDTPSDYALLLEMEKIWIKKDEGKRPLNADDAQKLLNEYPSLRLINKDIQQKSIPALDSQGCRKGKMYIPFALPSISKDEINEVIDTLKTGWLSTGPKTNQFEKDFAEYIGVKHAIGLTSCTAALHLALMAHGVGPGDEVIVPSFTFAATANMVVNVGAKPIFADIEESSYTLDIKDVERKISHSTKAIIPVHYAGYPCHLDEFRKLAQKHNLIIIEDAAHAVGSEYNGHKIGAGGNTTCFSFYATKNLATGEGGMLTTDDDKIAEFVRINRSHGLSKDAWKRYAKGGGWRYEVVAAGWKYNMFDLQAAIGIHQLKKLPKFTDVREEYAQFYDKQLSEIKGILLPPRPSKGRHCYHLYPIRVQNQSRDDFIQKLAEEGVSTSVHFIPNHLQPFYKSLGWKEGDLLITEKVFREIVSLPLYPAMTKEELNYITATIKKLQNGL